MITHELHWKCPHCSSKQVTKQDDLLGPFFTLACMKCGHYTYTNKIKVERKEIKR